MVNTGKMTFNVQVIKNVKCFYYSPPPPPPRLNRVNQTEKTRSVNLSWIEYIIHRIINFPVALFILIIFSLLINFYRNLL